MKIFLSKKMMVILLVCGVSIFAIKCKQQEITQKRGAPIVSSIQEHKEKGKPVYVKKIQKTNVDVLETFTVKAQTENLFQGFVTKDIVGNLAQGQRVGLEVNGLDVKGTLINVSSDINVETGLYSVTIKTQTPVKTAKSFIVCHAYVDVIENVINIDNEHAQYENGEYYAWIVQGDQAFRKLIKIKSQNGYGLIISSGVQTGDTLVLAGQSKLVEGDKVLIVNN